MVNASSYGVGGVIIGELSPCPPMVFHQQWPPDVTESVISEINRGQKLTNLDLKLPGLVLLLLMIEHVCTMLREKTVALFSNNSPTVSWLQQKWHAGQVLLQSNSYVSSLYVSMLNRAVHLQPFTLQVIKIV